MVSFIFQTSFVSIFPRFMECIHIPCMEIDNRRRTDQAHYIGNINFDTRVSIVNKSRLLAGMVA